MKKFLSVFLATILFATCFTGCKKFLDDSSSAPVIIQEDAFVKPQNYALVVEVSINPQFKLYLDADSTVLAVDFVNDDAKSIATEVSFKNLKVDEVVCNILEAANDNGFMKNGGIEISAYDIKDENVDAEDLLLDISAKAEEKIDEFDFEYKSVIILSVERTASESTTTSKNEMLSEETSKDVTNDAVTENSSSGGAIYIEKPEYTYPSYSEKQPESMPTSPNIPDASSDSVSSDNSKVEKDHTTNDAATNNDADCYASCSPDSDK